MAVDYYNLSVVAWNVIYQGISFLSALLSSIFTGIGLYLLITKRKSISRYFNLLTNFSRQNTISELYLKLNDLNKYNADTNDLRIRNEIECILHEINGQIEGNQFLKENFVTEQGDLQKFMLNPDQLSEPLKRGLVSMLREKLKFLNLETYNEFTRGDNE
jgi:hypothetical protein